MPAVREVPAKTPNTTEVQRVVADMRMRHPGRVEDFIPAGVPPKPTAEETSYRSLFYVSSRHSADGNDYVKGEPIPLAEAIRQGVVEDEELPAPARAAHERTTISRPESAIRVKAREDSRFAVPSPDGLCARCRGTGRRMKGHDGSHKAGCPGCQPCKQCGGTGTVPE